MILSRAISYLDYNFAGYDYHYETYGEHNMQSEARPELFTDYQEISPWNTDYVKRFQSVKKPWYKYLSGTMSDLHAMCQPYPVLLLLFAFLRSFGMFIGISNPFLGLCVLISVLMDNVYIFVFYCVAVSSGMGWCFYLKINKEMIYNGLYPCQAIMVSVYMTLVHEKDDNLWTLLPILCIMSLIEILTFQTLCELLVVRLKCSPSTIAGILWSLIFMISTRGSWHFNTILSNAGFVHDWDPSPINITLGMTPKKFAWETLRGAAFYSATKNVYGAIPLYIGVAVASPILATGMWIGSALGVGSAWIMGIDPDDMFDGAYGVNGAVIFANLSSVYFVLNIHSVIISTFGTFATVLGCIAMNYLLAPSGVGCSVLPSILVIILVYLSRNHFPRLIPVELACLTTPEDHITRYLLSQRIVRHLDIRRYLSSYKHISGDKLQNLERGLLPILMCSYVARDERKKMNKLLLFGANPNTKDYDGRTPLHIAAAENKVEMSALLLKYQNNINALDNFGNTATTEALNSNNFEMAEYLHSLGGEVVMNSEKLGTKLCYLVEQGNNTALDVWMKCGANPNSADYDKRTPLHLAYDKDNKKALEILIKNGADGKRKDKWGNTPDKKQLKGCTIIEMAAKCKKGDTKQRPLTMDLLSKRKKGHEIQSEELIAAVILALLENDDEIHRESLLPSLLCTAANCGFEGIVREVTPRLKDPNPGDYDKRTPLHLAAENGDLQLVRILVKNGAKVDCFDRFGSTPLIAAILREKYKVADYLRANGATLSGLDAEMVVDILFTVVFNNDIDMLEALFESGLDFLVSDYDGRSVFGQAKDVGSKGILKFLNSEKLQDLRKKDGQLRSDKSLAPSPETTEKLSEVSEG